jgi:hypothetical protein
MYVIYQTFIFSGPIKTHYILRYIMLMNIRNFLCSRVMYVGSFFMVIIQILMIYSQLCFSFLFLLYSITFMRNL